MRLLEKLPGRHLTTLVAVCAIGLAAAGCGDDAEEGDSASGMGTTTSAAETTSASGDGSVTIFDFKYDPEATAVAVGTEVVWTNDDMADHTATADDDSFDTGVFGKGEEGSVTLDEPGIYAYHCDLHPFMKGEVVVE